MKSNNSFSGGLLYVFVEGIFGIGLPLLILGCFVFFDLFHVKETWLQVTIVVIPLVVGAFILSKREKNKTANQRPNPSSIADE